MGQLLQTGDLDHVHNTFTVILSGACEWQSRESCIAGNVCKDLNLVACNFGGILPALHLDALRLLLGPFLAKL